LIGVNRPPTVRAFLRLVAVSLGLLANGGFVSHEGRRVEVRAFPASVDVDHIGALAAHSIARHEVPRVREKFGDPRTLILGVERLDYTKGVGERLAAFAALLADGRLDARDTVHVQVAAPSRQGIPAYRTLRARIDGQVRAINARFGRPGHPVVHA